MAATAAAQTASHVLTKALTHLVLPPGSAVLLLLLALFLGWRGWRRTAWTLIVVAVLGLAALSTGKVADALARGLESAYPPVRVQLSPQADAIVVLGGTLKPALPPRHEPDLDDAADRLLHAARLFREGKAPKILVSGGASPWSGAPRPEAASMANLLAEWGVPKEAVMVEARAEDTNENVQQTARYLAAHGAKRILLVTSALHMKRAMATFARTDLEVIPAPTDFIADEHPETILDWLPSARKLDVSSRALHEHLGLLYYRLRGWAE